MPMQLFTFQEGEVKRYINLQSRPRTKNHARDSFILLGGELEIPVYDWKNRAFKKEVLASATPEGKFEEVRGEALQKVKSAGDGNFSAFPYLYLSSMGTSFYSNKLARLRAANEPWVLVRVITSASWSLYDSRERLAEFLAGTARGPLCIAKAGTATAGDYLFVFRKDDSLHFRNASDPTGNYVLNHQWALIHRKCSGYHESRMVLYKGSGQIPKL